MFESIKAGKQLDLPSEPTLSDGTAGGIEVGSITFALCQEIIDEFILVDEEDISEEYDLSKLDEHTLGVLDAMKKFL